MLRNVHLRYGHLVLIATVHRHFWLELFFLAGSILSTEAGTEMVATVLLTSI